jgi:hypothetical protein
MHEAKAQLYTAQYLLKATTLEPEKQPLLDKGSQTINNGVTAGSGVFCVVCAEDNKEQL